MDETALGPPLAVLREIKNQVRYKNPGDIFWQTGTDGQKLYNKSEVFVDEASRAALYFSGNRRARLAANTLLKLSLDPNDSKSLVLALDDGSFNLRNGDDGQVSFILKVDEAGLNIGTDKRFDLFVKKREGGLGLAMASGNLGIGGVSEKQDLKEGETIVVKERNSQFAVNQASEKVEFYIEQTLDSSVKLIHPSNNQIVYQSKQPQLFQWSGGSNERTLVQYSYMLDFAEYQEVDVTGANLYTIPAALRGEVFWRIVSYYKGLPQYSTAGFFKVADINEVAIDQVALNFISKGKWQLTASVKEEQENNYEFQVSQAADFKETYDAYLGKQPMQSMVDVSGDLFVRVRRVYDSGLVSAWSSPKTVQVRPPLSTPVLKLDSQEESLQGVVVAQISWEADPAATVFILHSSKFADFTSFQSQVVDGKKDFILNNNLSNQIYYRVLAQSPEGEMSLASNSVVIKGSKLIAQKLAASAKEAPAIKAPKAIVEEKASPIANQAPADKAIFYTEQKIVFTWEGTADFLQMSSVSNFSQDVQSFNVKGKNTYETTFKNPTKFFWRVVHKKQNTAPSRSLSVLPKSDILIESVDLKFVERGKWKIHPRIQGAKPGEVFRVQIGKSSDFAQAVEVLGNLSEGLAVDQQGTFFIRAKRTAEGKDISKWSNVATQFIRPPLDTPVLGKDEEILASSTSINLTLSWGEVKNAKEYILEIDDTAVFGNVQKSFLVRDQKYTVQHGTLEPAYLRIMAKSAEGEISPPSKIYKIKGLLPGPKVDRYEISYGKLDEKGDSDKVHILWSHRKNAKKYIVEIGRREDLKDAEKFETVNIEFFKPVQVEGWYYFRLRPISNSAEFFEAPSQVYGIEYRKEKGLSIAALEQPGTGESFTDPQVRFSWGQVLGAAWYELELSRSADFTKSTLHKVEARDYTMRPGLDKGTWYYRVRGRSPTQQSPWSQSTHFKVK
ncbi:fibronectin type III domain-containing protein [Bdellovibrio reynosensis]|uniref:Fibronectin type-III domain-containing protein n=1 Tax=Bdellovibrio reynosensis TaxID=2835041 RepID=A0ABY4C806_9BACT|nr:hypothetical protein [Bdellovibrio reynosensis]UOF01055.1 hypothetical protein MNR06_15245 [Bdellovibrio reynosensis]